MLSRILLSGLVALPLAVAGAGHAAAQTGDQRVVQLEEEVRRLTGTVEELNFQILQMQDQLRRLQEDYELRFEELEERRSDASGTRPSDHAAAPPAVPPAAQQESGAAVAGSAGTGDDEFYAAAPRVEDEARVLGAPPRDFGTITFDADGNPVGAGLPVPQPSGQAPAGQLSAAQPPAGQPPAGAPPVGAPTDNTVVAALPADADPDSLYRHAYDFVLSGDYATAEAGFRDLIARHPDSERAPDAHFWLGEALLAQQKPREAAEVFLEASRSFPDAQKAPDTMFKLGVSLAAMGQRDVACATLSETLQRFPDASAALREHVGQEQARISC